MEDQKVDVISLHCFAAFCFLLHSSYYTSPSKFQDKPLINHQDSDQVALSALFLQDAGKVRDEAGTTKDRALQLRDEAEDLAAKVEEAADRLEEFEQQAKTDDALSRDVSGI